MKFIASSSKPQRSTSGPYCAFNKEGDRFQTQTEPYYWQITFSYPVMIESYIISGESINNNSMTRWEVSYSIDGRNFTYLQTFESKDTRKNTEIFPLEKPIYCNHFRITGKMNTAGNSHLFFRCFDCFGYASKPSNRFTCKKSYNTRNSIVNELIILIASRIY